MIGDCGALSPDTSTLPPDEGPSAETPRGTPEPLRAEPTPHPGAPLPPAPPSPVQGSILMPAPEGRTARTFGPYDLLDELGRGSFGIVYRAYHRSLRRDCALKVLTPELSQGKAAERFLREGQSAAKIGRHSNIIQIFDAGTAEGVAYIAMEFIRGRPLDKVVAEKGPLAEEEILSIGRKLALALDHAHRCGIVHRDLKPANVMLTDEGEPVILDFGIAKDIAQGAEGAKLSVEGAIIGTPAFMSPEQAEPERGATDNRSDVYALGTTLYYAAMGRIPFEGAGVHEILYKVVMSEPDERPSLRTSKDLEAILLRAMEKAPEARYQTALEMADDLSRLAAGLPARARPVGSLGRLWRRARHHWETVSVLGLVLLVGLAVTTYSAYRQAEVRALWNDLSAEIATSTARETRNLVEPALPTLEELRLLAEDGLLPVRDQEQLANHFVVRFRFHKRFDWICFGDANGRFTGAERKDDGTVVVNRSWLTPSGVRMREEAVARDGTRTPLRSSDRWNYDARERPWFRAAVASPKGRAWTRPYPWFGDGGYGITLSLAYKDPQGQLVGVFTADFKLAAISRYLTERRIGTSGRAYLLDDDGTPVAGPGVQKPGGASDPALKVALERAPVSVSALPLDGVPEAFSFEHEGIAYSAALHRFDAHDGLPLSTIVLVPLDDFQGGAVGEARRFAVGLASGGVLVAALLLALAKVRRGRLRAAIRGGRKDRGDALSSRDSTFARRASGADDESARGLGTGVASGRGQDPDDQARGTSAGSRGDG